MSVMSGASSSSSLDLQVVKLVVLGAERTGKSSLISVFKQGTFNETYSGTVGLDNSEKSVYLPHGKVCKAANAAVVITLTGGFSCADISQVTTKLWDIGGHPRFRPLLPTYLKGTDGVMVVYSVTGGSVC